MVLENMIDEKLVQFNLKATDKEDAMKKVAHLMKLADKVEDEEEYLKGLFKREEEFETGIGHGIAIPHCKNRCVKSAAFSLVRLDREIEWGSMDGLPVKYVIMLAAPDNGDNVHLDMLASLSRKLMDQDFLQSLLKAESIDDIKKAFN